MATNKPYGDGHRNGQIKHRSQTFNGHNGRFIKRDVVTGKFMDVKFDDHPFKGVRKEVKNK